MQRFDRKFKMWDFHITHSQLLLRSHSTVTHPKNIDIIFGDVDYVELPTILFGLDLVEAGPEDYRKAEQVMDGPVAAERVFAIETTEGAALSRGCRWDGAPGKRARDARVEPGKGSLLTN